MNAKMMRALRELASGAETWIVAQHPHGLGLRRFCFVRLTEAMVVGTGEVVLVRGAKVPRIGIVRRFSFTPDPLGNERLEIAMRVEGRPTTEWIGRCDILGRAVANQPARLTAQ